MKSDFDYESKIWGSAEVTTAPVYLGALRLRYCLEDLKEIKGKVLDVGCGAGNITKAIKKNRPDLEVWGLDLSRKAINKALERPEGVRFISGSAYKIPFENQSFDAVIFFDFLEHVDTPSLALKEIGRVLKNKGLLHAFVPCENEWLTYTRFLCKLGWKNKERFGGHIQNFTFKSLENELEKAGFSVKKTRWSCHLFYQLVDFSYFIFLGMIGRNLPYSVEGLLAHSKKSLGLLLLELVKRAIALISFVESSILAQVPGMGVHVLAYKK